MKDTASRRGIKQQFRGTLFDVEFNSKIKLEIVVLDKDMSKTLNAIIKNERTGDNGDGKIFILPVDDAIRVRTGNRTKKTI
ncbi:P-II family nitrogen regulator [Chloroflexota bacterium]